MKKTLSTLCAFFFLQVIFGQVTNIKTGVWSDKTVWSNNTIPTVADDITLNFDITVDINASCNSLNLNGHNITVNAGINFQISGTGAQANDSSYLSKYHAIIIDSNLVDTVNVTTYYYDSLRRVISMIDTADGFYSEEIRRTYYSYHLNDTLPYKSAMYGIAAGDPSLQTSEFDTLITYHFYDNDGKNIKDSILKSQRRERNDSYYATRSVRFYSYSTNKIFGVTQSYPDISNNIPLMSQVDTAILDDNGNIISNRRYFFNTYLQRWGLSAISSFTYDTVQSPFAKLSNFKTFRVFPSGETLYSDMPQNNNRLSQNELNSISDDYSGSQFGFYITNTYNARGLLVEVQAFQDPPFDNSYTKIVFSYIKR